jgi:hypothetical protein
MQPFNGQYVMNSMCQIKKNTYNEEKPGCGNMPKAKRTKTSSPGQKAWVKAYQDLQKQASDAWEKYQSNVKKKAKMNVIAKDHLRLVLLLGECEYMARECMRMAAKSKK